MLSTDNNISNSNINTLIDLTPFLTQEKILRFFTSETQPSRVKKIELESTVSTVNPENGVSLFLKNAISNFWERNKGKRFERVLPKLVLFASTTHELNTFLRPAVEKIIDDMHLSTIKVLGIPGRSGISSVEELREFENLDTPGSEKQFILLTSAVKKVWICRSIFGIALPFKMESGDHLLQQLTYLENPRKLTPSRHGKLTPFGHFKLTP